MTQEDKELLLKDLCARLPYRFIIHRYGDNVDIKINTIDDFSHFLEYSNDEKFKPYLRPMSSMTEEELYEVQEILGKGVEIHDVFISIVDSSINTFSYLELQAVFDWFNKKMFDYRGLIPMGLALEAPEGMYK